MRNSIDKRNSIASLIADLGGKGCRALADLIKCSFNYVKKCYLKFIGQIEIVIKPETRGRKSYLEILPNLKCDLTRIIENDISTDPRFKTEIMYVRLTLDEIRLRLMNDCSYDENKCPCKKTIANILNSIGYKLKKIKKIKPLKKIAETNAIFANVNVMKDKVTKDENTVFISIDAKDKVAIGEYSRNGLNRGNVIALDHDLTNDLLTPFGILDLKTNKPYFYNTTSKVTAQFITDVLDDFWNNNYSNSENDKLVIFLDNGPENASGRTYFIKGLTEMADKYNIKIELTYYPPYHSKYNPVERLWSRLEKFWNGYLLSTIDTILNYMKNLTWKDQSAFCKLIDKVYCPGLTLTKSEMKELENKYITRTPGIEKWSLFITPFVI